MPLTQHTFEVTRPGEGRVCRRSYKVSDAGLVDPRSTSPLPLLQGEWVDVNNDGELARVTTSTRNAFIFCDIPGDSSNQAKAMGTVIEDRDMTVRTKIYNAALTYVINDLVTAKTVTISGQNRAGLTNDVLNGNFIVGVVSKPPATAGDWMEIRLEPGIYAYVD